MIIRQLKTYLLCKNQGQTVFDECFMFIIKIGDWCPIKYFKKNARLLKFDKVDKVLFDPSLRNGSKKLFLLLNKLYVCSKLSVQNGSARKK